MPYVALVWRASITASVFFCWGGACISEQLTLRDSSEPLVCPVSSELSSSRSQDTTRQPDRKGRVPSGEADEGRRQGRGPPLDKPWSLDVSGPFEPVASFRTHSAHAILVGAEGPAAPRHLRTLFFPSSASSEALVRNLCPQRSSLSSRPSEAPLPVWRSWPGYKQSSAHPSVVDPFGAPLYSSSVIA